jgi:LmbE family N-acetylglucosaminyl deacetylase
MSFRRPCNRRPTHHGGTSFTIVFFHAHPDDEALLTGGTMARLAAEGHRVVLVTATAGEKGLSAKELTASTALGDIRLAELLAAATALGCARTVVLGYADSGSTTDGGSFAEGAFAALSVEEPAQRLAELLLEESADALTIYDRAGGYGHPDHQQVHLVGGRAAQLAGTRLMLEATVDRSLLRRGLSLGRWFAPRTADFDPDRFDALFSAPQDITHRVNVSGYLNAKRAAMSAHHSQSTTDAPIERGLGWMLRLPKPLYRLAFGREWFIERGRPPGERPIDDILDTLRGTSGSSGVDARKRRHRSR